MGGTETTVSWWQEAHLWAYDEFYRRCASQQLRLQTIDVGSMVSARERHWVHPLTRSQQRRKDARERDEVL